MYCNVLRMVERQRKPRATRPARGTHDSQLVVRLPGTLVGRVDAFAERMRVELPGVRFARAEAVRVLLTRALDQLPLAVAPSSTGRRGR